MKKILCLILSVALVLCVFATSGISSASNVLFGDANGDGAVDPKDVLTLRKLMARLITNSDIDRFNSDVNYDGKVNTIDIRYIREYLAGIRDTITPAEYTTIATDAVTYSIKELEKCITLQGRAVYVDNVIKLSQTASGFQFNASCNGNIIVNYSASANCKLAFVVDGDYENTVLANAAKGDNLTCYATLNMSEGEHTIEIRKATEWSQCSLVTIDSIILSGEPGVSKPAEKVHRIEFYGDSITSGYGNLSEQISGRGSWEWQDGTRTYASYAAHALNADYAVASASGHGVLGGYSNKTDVYSKFFDYSLVSEKTAWSRTDYDADLIVINFGTNDDSRDNTELDTDAFKAECRKIIEQMHADNPDAQILWVIGMNYIDNAKPVIVSLQNIAEEYDYVNFYKSVAAQNGGDWHPNIADHKNLGAKLVNKINELYPDMFK